MHIWLDQVGREGRGEAPEDLLVSADWSARHESGAELGQVIFASRYEWGCYIEERLQEYPTSVLQADIGLWSWLALACFDAVCPKDANGSRKVRQRARYVPSGHDYRTYYRHLLAGPWRVVRAHRDDPGRAMAVLTGRLDQPGELAEQLMSKQDIISSAVVMAAATRLYIDPATGRPKRGAGGSGRASPRRLTEVLLQFDVTYDIYGMTPAEILDLLPAEFSRYKVA